MPPVVRAVKAVDWVTVYRTVLFIVLSVTGWLASQVYTGLQNGTTASAQTAAKAVTVAVDAKTSIAQVSSAVAVITQRQTDAEKTQADALAVQDRIAEQVDKLTESQSNELAQLSAINAKLDDLTGTKESIGSINAPIP